MLVSLDAEIEKVLDYYGDQVKDAIKTRLTKDNKYASGKAANTLIKKVTPRSLQIEGWKYIEVISGGREPGKQAPPIGKIVEWLENKKGMTIRSERYANKKYRIGSLAYIIARNIGKNGIKGNNMLTDIKNDFAPRIDADLADVIQAEIVRITTEINKKTNK